MKIAVTMALAAQMLGVSAAGAVSLKEAGDLLLAGQYEKAEAAYQKLVRSGQRGPALLGMGRLLLETGRHGQAIVAARKAARGKLRPQALTLVGETQRQMGQLTKAEATLKQVVRTHPKHYRALVYLGIVYHEQGKMMDAKGTFDVFYDDYGSDKMDKTSAEQLTYVAMACRYTDNFRDAADTFQEAIQLDGKHLEALVQLAEISLEKYEAGWAERHYERVLKVNPHSADALVGLARVKLEQSNDVSAALKLLDRAEKTNPTAMESQVVRARILLDAEENHRAEALLTKALQRNPNHLGALTMMAASFFLRDDLGSFKRMQSKVLALNRRYARFFHTVVQLAVRHHRYTEAIELSKQAIQIDPQDWYSLADLGTNYLRMGDDANGLKYLKEAWKGDPFNVRNYNLLNLFEDVVAKEYTFINTKHFRIRVHREEKELVQRTTAPLLERAYGIYVKKYRFKPKGPIVIELFRDPSHYAVRTVGLPGLGALGVCFGRVITTSSPMNGGFNWGQVLWHELNHVFTIQMTRSRVPRWLTEGLADMEPIQHRPEWKRENDFDIYKALRAGRLKGLASLKTAFSRAKNLQEMVVAYYQGSLLVTFLIKHWGMAKMLKALREYGKGKSTEQILPALSGLGLDEIDRRFKAAQLRRLAHYSRSWYVDLESYDDLEDRQKQAKARPGDSAAQAELAMALLVAGKRKEADALAEKVLKRETGNRLSLYVRAQVAEPKAAQVYWRRLLAAGGDSFETRLALGKAALSRKDLTEAQRHLNAAKKLDPEKGHPYALLAKTFEKQKKIDKAIDELKGLAQIDQQSFPMVAKLVSLLARKKDYKALRTYGEMAYYINPASLKLHTHLAEAFTASAPKPDLARAIWHLETALLCQPEKPADLYVKLARLHLRRGDRRRAQIQLDRALKANPDHAGAKDLRKDL